MKFIFTYRLGSALANGAMTLSIHHGAEFLRVQLDTDGCWELIMLADTDEPREDTTIYAIETGMPAEFTTEVVYVNSVRRSHFFAEVRP